MKLRSLYATSVGMMIMPALVSCGGDDNDMPKENQPEKVPEPVVEEIKEDRLVGQWELLREDSGCPITTVFTLNSDKSCEYSQKIGDDKVTEIYVLTLVGKWMLDDTKSKLSFVIADSENENIELTINAVLASDQTSFTIDDSYAEMDNYAFKKK